MRNLYYETISALFNTYHTILDVKKIVVLTVSGVKTMTWDEFATLAKSVNYEPNEKRETINKSLTIYLKDSTKMIRWYSTKHGRISEYWLSKKCHPAEEFPNIKPIDFIAFPENSEIKYVID
jgi:hypothetical protein